MRARYFIFVFLLAAMLSPTLQSQTSSSRDQNQIISLEQQLTDAANQGDAMAVDKYLATEYGLTSITGTTASRDQALEGIRKHQEQNTISNVRVRVLGDAAVATYDSNVTGPDPQTGTQVTRKIVENDFWVKRGGHWVLLASQGSPAQPIPPEMWSSGQSQ